MSAALKDNSEVALALAGVPLPDAHEALNRIVLALRPLDTRRRAMVLTMAIKLLDSEEPSGIGDQIVTRAPLKMAIELRESEEP
jgi:hypothetical protein